MKRLWIRLAAVAGVVASLGGGGYYFVNSGTATNEASEDGTKIAQAGSSKQPETIVPLTDKGGRGSPAFGDPPATVMDNRGFGDVSSEPTEASWRDQTGQPIRQVSSSQPEGVYGDTNFQMGDSPAADPASTLGDRPYDPSHPYGDSGADLPPSPRGYGGPDSGYGDEGASASATTAPGYPTNDGATDTVSDDYGNNTSGYGAPAAVVAPPAPSQDFSQPVTAPSFANGDTVGSGNLTTGEFGTTPDVNPSPTVGSSAPPLDSSPVPEFDPPSASAVAPSEPLPVAAYPPAGPGPPAYSQPPAMAAGSAALVAATPGARSLDGRQTPSISVEKTAPTEIQVGKPAAFKALVRNTGVVTAKNVVVMDRPPQGTQLVDATPRPIQTPDGSLVWQFDSLAPGEEVLISMEVMPQVEGEIGSVARITFEAQASVRTICTKPQLLVEHSTEPKVLIGEDVVFAITISNPGSGDATGIILEEDVPRGLSHVAGSELELPVGTLRPGESRRLELVLKASEAGVTSNKLRVRGDASLLAEHATQLEVIAPKLVVGLTGPRRRYLDRQVKYQVTFHNAGTAIARNVELATYLPKGLRFVSTSGKGQYDTRDHAVYWSLDQLAPGQVGEAELIAVPVATGEQKLRIEGTADLGLSHTNEHTTAVEGITELAFTVADTQDPIEVGSETIYEVRIVNKGSKTATNVQIAAILPAELTPLSGDGTSRVAIQGQQVVMEPLERLGPQDDAVYKIKVKGAQAGDHIIDVRLVCDEVPTPVTKQESTKVYADGL